MASRWEIMQPVYKSERNGLTAATANDIICKLWPSLNVPQII